MNEHATVSPSTPQSVGPRGQFPARRAWLAPLLVVVVAFGVYANTLASGYSWDDTWLIVSNDRLEDPGYVRYMLLERTLWRPLKRISFMVDAAAWGRDTPAGFHLTNVLLHALASWLVFVLARRLRVPLAGALAAGLVFAVHAAHVEAVANISHRKEPMALAFSLLGMLAWLAARGDPPPRGLLARLFRLNSVPLARVELTAWTALAWLCGLLSKEVGAIMLPAAIVLHELLASRGEGTRPWRRLAVLAVPVVLVLALFWQRGYLGTLTSRFTPEQVSWVTLGRTSEPAAIPLIALKAFGFHAGFMACPWPSYADRAFAIPTGPLDPGVLGGALALVAWFGGLAFTWRRSPAACLGLGWFGLNLLPVINAVPLTFWLVAERFSYGPSAGLALAAGAGFAWLWEGRVAWVGRPLLASGLVAILAVHSVLTVRQNRVWKSDGTLWSHTLLHDKESWLAWHGVAPLHEAEGRLDDAERCYREAIRLNPRYAEPHYGLSRLLYLKSDFEGAIREARYRAGAEGGDAASFIVIGNSHLMLGQVDLALAAYEEATQRKPGYKGLAFNHANALRMAGRTGEALERMGPAPPNGEAKNEAFLRAILCDTLGRRDEAIASYRAVLAEDPTDATVLQALARLGGATP